MIYVGDRPIQALFYGGIRETGMMETRNISCTITFPKRGLQVLPVELLFDRDLEIATSNSIYEVDWGDGSKTFDCVMSPFQKHTFRCPTDRLVEGEATFYIRLKGPVLIPYTTVQKQIGSGANGFRIFAEEVSI